MAKRNQGFIWVNSISKQLLNKFLYKLFL